MATIPSIALIPSGVKAGKIYSVLPTDGSGDITFDRGNGTSTRINQQKLIESVSNDVPRLDYGGGDCPSLLLEPSRANLLPYSETFSNSSWIKSGASVVGNFASPSADSPSGAFALTSTGTGQIQAALFGQTAGVEYTVSFWIKRKTGTGVVNLRAIENTSTPITITNEWARYSATVTSSSTTVRAGIRLDTVGDEVYIFGAQLEVGSFATSYIPTSGSAQTRQTETASKTGISSFINSSEGVLFVNASALVNGMDGRITISDGTINNRVSIEWDATANTIKGFMGTNGEVSSTLFNQTNNLKIALSYKENDFKLYINGFLADSDSSANVPSAMNKLYFSNYNNANTFYGKVKDLRVYSAILTDAELRTLTTI